MSNSLSPVNFNWLYSFLNRFPFFAADVLASNAMILQALLEGGWNNDKGDEDEAKKEKKENDDLEGNDENTLVQSAIDS